MTTDNPSERNPAEPPNAALFWPFGPMDARTMAAFNPMTYAAMFTPPTPGQQGAPKTPPMPPDVLAYWRQVYNMGEEQATRYFQQLISSDIFAQTMNRYFETLIPTQEAIQRNVEKFLQGNGLPTRSDIAHLAEQIVTLDAKLDTVQDEIEDLLDNNNASLSATVATLQTGLDGIAAKLDRLLALETRVSALEKAGRTPKKTQSEAQGERAE